MTKRCFGILLVSMLAACASTSGYENAVSAWTGKSEEELVRAWGQPSDRRDEGGNRYLTFTKSGQTHVPATPPIYQTTVVGTTAFVQQVDGSPGYSYDGQCKTTFELAGSKIVSTRWEGNACTAN